MSSSSSCEIEAIPRVRERRGDEADQEETTRQIGERPTGATWSNTFTLTLT